MANIPEELMQSFISEASDLLDDVEPSLIEYSRMGTAADRTEIVNRVFRHFHSIKGSAGFVCLDDISRLTHEAETLLELYRKDSEKIIPQETINLLCRTVDFLRFLFEQEASGLPKNEAGFENIIIEIRNAIAAVKKTKTDLSMVNLSADQRMNTDITGVRPSGPATINPSPGVSASPPTPMPAQPKAEKAKTPTPHPGTISRGSSSHDTARVIRSTQAGTKKVDPAEFAGRYVSEANELLEQIEQAFLYAEQHPDASEESIRDALRFLHSFKGNSGLMHLVDLERLSHRMETEVERNTSRSLGIDSQIFDGLLQMIDILREGVRDYSCGGSGGIPEADTYIAMMNEYSSSKRATDVGVRPPSPDTDMKKLIKTVEAELPVTDAGQSGEKKKSPESAPKNTLSPSGGESAEKKPRKDPNKDDTTRVVLIGKTSYQENLMATPRRSAINMDAALAPESPAASLPPPARINSSPPPSPDNAGIGKGKSSNDKSDTMRRRKNSDQISGRNDIRVDLRKLDGILDLVGELVIAEAMVTRHPVVWDAENESLERAVHQLRRVTNSLQDMATSVRMIPLAPTFRRMTRLVYDLSVKASKQVDLILLGEETEVDRTVIERISDPLVHIIRNAIDHGIEPPAERVALGKPEHGNVTIEGHHEGGEVWIVVTDDGRGLDREAILNKAVSRGLVSGDGSELTDNQVYHFIFEPGFSTAAKVTDISGRGFGMDVVKKNIEKLSGKIDVRSRPGEGLAVVMRIPLTLAIIDGMLVSYGGTQYIIPLLSIRETIRPDLSQVFTTPDGQQMVRIRDELIPIVMLNETFSRVHKSRELSDGILMIVEGEEGDVVALFADELLGQQETVIKGLSGWLKMSRGVSGCTILGDGEVGLILDIGSIVKLARQSTPV
ncbi:MAG: chemotaxis protein CheA [Planctomycetota bacterium]|jgi:two-component system chemotaxis sensor kinase CheA|nr:chemotaxis protein CheA [Planctomycetota bacterium]